MLAVGLVALLPAIASADENRRKANAAHPNNAAQHRASPQQHALNQGNSNGTAPHHGYGYGAGVGRHPGVGMGQNRNQATGPMVSSLHSVVASLQQADHDYNGHRMKAIQHLDHAIRTLQPGSAGTRIGVGAGGSHNNLAGIGSNGRGAGNNGPRIPQAQSDAHLRQAHEQLLAVESQMFGGGNMAAHHQQAHTHVQRAIQELNVALAAR